MFSVDPPCCFTSSSSFSTLFVLFCSPTGVDLQKKRASKPFPAKWKRLKHETPTPGTPAAPVSWMAASTGASPRGRPSTPPPPCTEACGTGGPWAQTRAKPWFIPPSIFDRFVWTLVGSLYRFPSAASGLWDHSGFIQPH